MLYLVLGLVALGLITGVLTMLFQKRGAEETPIEITPTCSTCNGEDDKCEQECMMEAATKEVEYFDDEELDAFAGRSGDSYTDQEIEQFGEVLYTLHPEEVKAWNRSLILRGITIPDALRDELIALMTQ